MGKTGLKGNPGIAGMPGPPGPRGEELPSSSPWSFDWAEIDLADENDPRARALRVILF